MSELFDIHTEAGVAAHLLESRQKFEQLHAPKADTVLVFSDKTVTPLEKFSANPLRKRATASFMDADSLSAYINAHKIAAQTVILGTFTIDGGKFVSVLDYHAQGETGAANWGQHVASFTPQVTPEWARWNANNDKLLPQVVFANFIEDNLPDIVSPASADLLEIVQDLVAKKSVNFRSSNRLSNGESALVYEEQIESSGTKNRAELKVPNTFTIFVAPFVGCEPVSIDARLRFRIEENGRLSFSYILNRPHKVIEAAFKAMRQEIASKTGLPVLLGSASVTSVS